MARIPVSVEQAILSWHNEMKRQYGHGLPDSEWLAMGLSFWDIEDDEELAMFLTEELVSALYGSNIPGLPPGYAPLVRVLEFERHRQFEGWTAIANKGDSEVRQAISDYRLFGLADEADALDAVLEAYLSLADEEEQFNEALERAYISVPNTTTDIDQRMPLLLRYVRANPQQFAASVA